ncbi:hypothetical protein [Klebsiella aerogenes]|uniref:hypothetical protein n=1 Tax=Klebsiella aerogenes TaxID=548 RepID=UPI001255C550|nr:hypothetical protein [Klebsiella aerogenes]VAG21001.1 Uncharacterised protein [Klebsiella aerogenes]
MIYFTRFWGMCKKYFFAFAAGGIAWMLLDVYVSKGIDKGSYPDWISSVCNIVMACATVGAVLTARNYLAQFTAQEGYKLAIKFFNESFHEILPLSIKLEESIGDVVKFYNDIADEGISDVELNGFISNTHNISAKLFKFNEYKKSLDKELNSIATYGLHLNDEWDFLYKQLTEDLNDLGKLFSEFSEQNQCYIEAMEREFKISISNHFGNIRVPKKEFIKQNDNAYYKLVNYTNGMKTKSKNIKKVCNGFINKSEVITNIFCV